MTTTAITLGAVQRARRAKGGVATPRPRRRAAARKVDLPAEFVALWFIEHYDKYDDVDFEREYKFDPRRRWRFDLAHVDSEVAIEFDGATHAQGRHTRGKGYEADQVRTNAAVAAGWVVLRYTTQMLRRNPSACVAQVRAVIEMRLRRA